MTLPHIRIDPVRRHYNQCVNNEMLEDCALRFTALKSRRWSCMAVANTALGAISFLALEAIGAAITLQYGPTNAIMAIIVASLIIFLLGVPVAIHAATSGVDIDLLTRGAGFGYLGSTITSLIYAGFTFIYFALEAAIMASALNVCFGVPLSIGYLLSSLAIIPIVVYGITMISQMQRFTQHIWLLLQIAPFAFLAWQSVDPMPGWEGIGLNELSTHQPFDIVMFGAASAVVFSLIVQIGEQVDYLRFLPPRTRSNRTQWWAALLCAGPGWIIIGALKMLAGAYLGLLAVQQGVARFDASDPVYMYLNAWSAWLTPELALAVTGIFVIVCQFKINITNSYAGSIAWSNFFSRLTHSHPGRVVWLVFNVTIAWMLMELGVYQSLENTLSLYSILGISWIGAVATDLAVNKTLGISPPGVHFKRAQLFDINPVGVFSMGIATAIGFIAYSGLWGETAQAMATYMSLVTVVILVPTIALLTRGRYYLVNRQSNGNVENSEIDQAKTCIICRSDYDREDMIHCPAYEGNICSLCCSLDTRCENQCRPNAQFLTQLRTWTIGVLPAKISARIDSIVLQYMGLLLVAGFTLAFVFGLVYLQSGMREVNYSSNLSEFLHNLYSGLFILAAIITWMFLLTSESARRASADTVRQNQLLVKEIEAHERTEKALNLAKEKAEAANQAKSRYVVGLSHELRTPLNSIQGYAQLMEQDVDAAPARKNGVRVIRDSARHLSGLIENLLDISKIESDRITIHRDRVDLFEFLDQLVQMFQWQAQSNDLEFRFTVSPHLPRQVYADEKRLRQILINLLSNAFKYTTQGYVELSVNYRAQLTTFQVTDTGVGIPSNDLHRIYEPFETLADSNPSLIKGTGLGLTISKLLAEIMGGDLTAESNPGQGSCFTLKLLLPPLENQDQISGTRQDFGRKLKSPKLIAVVDDDESHRQLLTDFLAPMGFHIHGYADAQSCLDNLKKSPIDVYLLDISLPGMSGWELASELRLRCEPPVRIMMISALADSQIEKHKHDAASENYFVKPLDLNKLLFRLQNILALDWQTQHVSIVDTPTNAIQLQANVLNGLQSARSNSDALDHYIDPQSKDINAALPPTEFLNKLQALNTIGHFSGIKNLLDQLGRSHPDSKPFIVSANRILERHDLKAFGHFLDKTCGGSDG